MCSTEVMREPILIKAKACTKIYQIYMARGYWRRENPNSPEFTHELV